jgi:hypothetical protein
MGELPKATPRTSGHLTVISEPAPGILLCGCACMDGWTVLVAAEAFPKMYGCSPACHQSYLDGVAEAERQRIAEAEYAAARTKEEERIARLEEENIEPHLDELDSFERRLLERLLLYPEFSVADVCKLLKKERWQDVWPYILDMLKANLLLEIHNRGAFPEVRPYRYDECYASDASPYNRFRVRDGVKQVLRAEIVRTDASEAVVI